MAEYKYNRQYELIVSRPYTEPSIPQEQYFNDPLANDFVVFKTTDDYAQVNLQENVTITELHFTADITSNNKTSGSKGNVAQIKIYNLNEANRDKVARVNNYVVLNAGYSSESDIPMIYSGQIETCYTIKEDADYVTYLICKSGYTPSNSIRISLTMMIGRTYEDVLLSLADIWRANGVSYTKDSLVLDQSPLLAPVIESSPRDTELSRSYVFTGYLRKAMDDVCQMFNLSWRVLNNTLYVTPKYYDEMVEQVELSNADIVSIQPKQDGSRLTSNNVDKKGITLKILLDGRIKDSVRLLITEGDYKGSYRISSVAHKLSFEGQEWYTEIEAEEI